MVAEYLSHVRRFSRPARLFLAAQFLYGSGQSAVWVLRNLYLKEAGFAPDFIGPTPSAQSLGMAAVVVAATPPMDRMRGRPFQGSGVMFLAAGLAAVTRVGSKAAILGACFLSWVWGSRFWRWARRPSWRATPRRRSARSCSGWRPR